jgi:hypothetical protein
MFRTSSLEEVNRKFDAEQECGDQNSQRCHEHDSCAPNHESYGGVGAGSMSEMEMLVRRAKPV